MMSPLHIYSMRITEWRYFPAFFILVITFFSIIVSPGYESFTGDQTIFIPPLYHELDPTLFQNDLEPFKVMHTERTFLTHLLASCVRLGIPLLWVLFSWTILMRVVFFSALYFIWRYFTNNKHYALFILLIFIVGFSIPGTGHETIESAFSYRTISIPLSMAFLALYLYEWRLLALAPLLFAFTIHPITALPFFLFYYLCLLHDAWNTYRQKKSLLPYLVHGLIPALFVFFFFWYTQNNLASDPFLIMDNAWKQLARKRNAPAFFEYWSTHAYLSLLSWFILASVPFFSLHKLFPDNHRKQVLLKMLFLTPVIMLALAGVGETTMLHAIVKINLQRGLLLLVFTAAPLFALMALWHADTKRDHILENGFLFAILTWFLVKVPFVFLKEQMTLFLVPLVLLCVANIIPVFQHKRRAISIIAISCFMLMYGVVIARARLHADTYALIWFHGFLLAGFLIAYAYTYSGLTSIKLVHYSIFSASLLCIVLPVWYIPKFTINPRYVDLYYEEACRWVKQHTAPDDVFIVEPFAFVGGEPSQFRIICLRPIFTTFKDGGIVPYDEIRQDAFDWKHRYELIYALQNNWDTLNIIKQEYRVDYLFSERQLPIEPNHPLVFSNERFFIYAL